MESLDTRIMLELLMRYFVTRSNKAEFSIDLIGLINVLLLHYK
jgi:hypothetical protein